MKMNRKHKNQTHNVYMQCTKYKDIFSN